MTNYILYVYYISVSIIGWKFRSLGQVDSSFLSNNTTASITEWMFRSNSLLLVLLGGSLDHWVKSTLHFY